MDTSATEENYQGFAPKDQAEIRIRSVTPNSLEGFSEVCALDRLKYAASGTEVLCHVLDDGPRTIESAFDNTLAGAAAVQELRDTEERGFDALVIDCAGDGGLIALKEGLDCPVVGAMESAMHIACLLGRRFSILGVCDSLRGMYLDLVTQYRMTDRLVSVESIGFSVEELAEDVGRGGERLKSALVESGRHAIDAGADVVILGCTGMTTLTSKVSKAIGIPVINGGDVALKLAEMFVTLGLTQSKSAYHR